MFNYDLFHMFSIVFNLNYLFNLDLYYLFLETFDDGLGARYFDYLSVVDRHLFDDLLNDQFLLYYYHGFLFLVF